MTDNLIIDNFYLEYEVYESNYWTRHCCFARSFEVEALDWDGWMLLSIVTASGKTLDPMTVRNLKVREVK